MYGAEVWPRAVGACLVAALTSGLCGSQAPPASSATLRVGLFEPDEAWADRIQAGALWAQSLWNRDGEQAGFTLELVRIPNPARWSGAGAQLARFIVQQDLAAVIGPGESAAAHAAVQVATRLRVPIITLSSDATLPAAGDPWTFSLVPSDLQQARELLARALPRPEGTTALLVVPPGRAGRVRGAALRKACAERGIAASESCDAPAVVLLWLDADQAQAWLASRPAARRRTPILGSLRLRRPAFLASEACEAASLSLPTLGDAQGDLGVALGFAALRAVALAAASVGTSHDSIRAGLAALPPRSRLCDLPGPCPIPPSNP